LATPHLVYEEKPLYSKDKSHSITLVPIREGAMTAKRIFQSIVAVVILAASFASTGGVLAWSGCTGYVTAQWGDTLSSMAAACGTTVDAIRAANPGLGWQLYAGQMLYMPTGYTSTPGYYPGPMGGLTYVVQPGDTLGDLAVRNGVSVSDILAMNPQIWNASLIYPGQVINMPALVNALPSAYPTTATLSISYLSASYPSQVFSSQFGNLKVIYGHGLLVRTGPGTSFSEIVSPLVSAVKNSTWRYRKSSVTTDSTGFVWVEVALSQNVNGYSTGWILTRDSLGKYYTDPSLGAAIDPNDP
jgi:LysM repeat protein